jgi:plastocyanin
MKKTTLIFLSVCWLLQLSARTFIISNLGNNFLPQVTIAQVGDTLDFQISGAHNAIELDKLNWLANLVIPKVSGFTIPFGGGKMAMSSSGEKYFICSIHASVAMKGMIVVLPTSTIAYTGFEGSANEWMGTGIGPLTTNDTAQILAGDTISGVGDNPAQARIYDGLRSWQVNDRADTLLLAPIHTAGYDSLQLKFRFSATAINPGQGVDENDSILVFISLNGIAFGSKPTLLITGNNNNTWGFDADSIIQVQADSFTRYSVPSGTADTSNTASAAIIRIPYSTVMVRVMIIMKNNQNKEIWNMDAITLCGVKSRALPLLYQFLVLEKTISDDVKINWSIKNNEPCEYQYIQRSGTGILFSDIYKVSCSETNENASLRFVDLHPNQGVNYYRIKSLLVSGEILYSEIKSIDIRANAQRYKLYPTIATDYITLMNSRPDEIQDIQILTLSGAVIPNSIKLKEQGYYIGHLTAGVYKLICRTKTGLEVLSFIKM